MTAGSPQLHGRHVAVAAVTAAAASGVVYLLQHFAFHDDWGWVGVLIFFFVLFFLYLARPWIRRIFRGPNSA